jgi:hypothetical protein
MQFPPISTILKILYFFSKSFRHLDDEMHAFVFFCFQTLTLGYNRELYMLNPRLESINHCCSQKNMHVMWQKIPCHVMVYFATSFKVCHVEKNHEYSMVWHGIFLKILFYSNEQGHLFTCSPTSVSMNCL